MLTMTRDDPGREIVLPPVDASVFGYGSLRIMMLVCAAICAGFAVWAAVMQLLHPERDFLIVLLLVLLMCGAGFVYSLRVVRYSRDRIAVNSEGIWYLARNGPPTFMTWTDVGEVKANDTMQRLILTDASGKRAIRIEYQIEKFSALREFVLSHTSALARQAPAGTRVFHRTWINKIILGVLGLPFLFLAVECYLGGNASGSWVFFAGVLLLVLMIARDPVSLIIDPDRVLIRYPFWSRPISFDSISAITTQNVSSRGNVWAAVSIERKQKRKILLFRFREGSIALQDALDSAWRSSQASGIRV